MVNQARLSELGFELGSSAGGQSQGAWFATAPDGSPVLLKWVPDETAVERYTALLPALDELRDRGVPVPKYLHVIADDGWTISAQELLAGRCLDNPPPVVIDAMVECIAAKAGIAAPLASSGRLMWGDFMVHTLTVGEDGWAMHEPLRRGGRRSAAVLDRVQAIGAGADASWFPDDGLVHLDLHTDNVLVGDDATLTGIIDWEGACAGDHRFDLVQYAFDLDGHDQPVWEIVDNAGFDLRVLQSYVAHIALKCTDWAIRHHPHDVPRQLDRAERVFDRYGL